MAIIQNWLPPSRENWELIYRVWQFFPLLPSVQLVSTWYPMGKTSIESRLNLPGKWAWFTMEIPGFITLLYIMFTLPKELGIESLPWGNWVMAGMFTIHYIYRAILAPLVLNPSMSPIHIAPWSMAIGFQLFNALSLGGWLAGYGPATVYDWAGGYYRMEIGLVIWGWFLLLNFFHDDDLREIRRAAMRRAQREADKEGKRPEDVRKVYMLPKNGLFHYVLYPHYLCEWIEWCGFWMVGGLNCGPARQFVINEVAAMLPRALNGWHWYVEKFGRDKVGTRKAIIPGIL